MGSVFWFRPGVNKLQGQYAPSEGGLSGLPHGVTHG